MCVCVGGGVGLGRGKAWGYARHKFVVNVEAVSNREQPRLQ